MLEKTQVTKVAVAGFGAAMASVFAIPEAHATIIPISFSETLKSLPQRYSVKASDVDGLVFRGYASNGDYPLVLYKGIMLDSYASLTIKSIEQVIAATTFSGTYGVTRSLADSATEYFGFRNNAGQVGWFAINWGGRGGNITFLKGAVNTDEGGSIVVGQMSASVPEPSELGLFALGLLALGAAGVRLRREARKTAELN